MRAIQCASCFRSSSRFLFRIGCILRCSISLAAFSLFFNCIGCTSAFLAVFARRVIFLMSASILELWWSLISVMPYVMRAVLMAGLMGIMWHRHFKNNINFRRGWLSQINSPVGGHTPADHLLYVAWLGVGLALAWLWLGFGLALRWLWLGFGLALCWLWLGFGLAHL